MGETAVYPRELKGKLELEGKAPFWTISRLRMGKGVSPSAPDGRRPLLSPPNILKNKKTLA